LALHVGAAWMLLGQVVLQQPQPPKPPAFQVELREVSPPAPVPRPSPPLHVERTIRRPRQRRDPPEVVPPIAPPPSGRGELGPVASNPPPALATPGTGPKLSTDPTGVLLFPPNLFANRPGSGEPGPAAGNSPAERTLPPNDDDSLKAEHARVTGRMQGAIADATAQNRVASGLIDPYFHEVQEGMRDGWFPTAGLIGGADGDGIGAGVKNLLSGFHAVGKQWAKSGNPYPEGETPAGTEPTRDLHRPLGGTSGFDAADFAARWNNGEFAFSGGLVVVQLTQDPDGKPLEVVILKSSGFKAFDLSAKAAIAREAASRKAPRHGYGLGGTNIRSVWQLEARMVPNTCSFMPDTTGRSGASGGAGFVPASLQCGGTFDLGGGKATAEVRAPLQTRIITKVNLLAVYGGETNPMAIPR
jgi:TonB family protein